MAVFYSILREKRSKLFHMKHSQGFFWFLSVSRETFGAKNYTLRSIQLFLVRMKGILRSVFRECFFAPSCLLSF